MMHFFAISLGFVLPPISIWSTICHANHATSAMLQRVANLISKLSIAGLENAFTPPPRTYKLM